MGVSRVNRAVSFSGIVQLPVHDFVHYVCKVKIFYDMLYDSTPFISHLYVQ